MLTKRIRLTEPETPINPKRYSFGNLVGPTPLVVTISDSDALFVDNIVTLGYGNILRDTLSVSDQIILDNYAKLVLNDTLTLSDYLAIGYGFHSLGDTLPSQTDLIKYTVGVVENFSDSLSVLDSLKLILGDLFKLNDTLSQSDAITRLGYGAILSDQTIFTDSLVHAAAFKVLLADSILIIDKLLFCYGLIFGESFTLSESLNTLLFANLTKLITGDQLSLADGGLTYVLIVNLVKTINDAITTFQDQVASLILNTQLTQALGDSANNFLDSLKVVKGLLRKLTDQLPAQADLFKIQPIAAVYLGDTLSFVDSFRTTFAKVHRALQDAIAQYDQIFAFYKVKPTFGDNIQNYGDSITPTLGIHLGFHDLLLLNDSIMVGTPSQTINLLFGDSTTFAESLAVREGSIEDDISYIRRYLNDIEGILTPPPPPIIEGPPPPPFHPPPVPSPIRDYLRRYLNDV